jgi:hypothetical protein
MGINDPGRGGQQRHATAQPRFHRAHLCGIKQPEIVDAVTRRILCNALETSPLITGACYDELSAALVWNRPLITVLIE